MSTREAYRRVVVYEPGCDVSYCRGVVDGKAMIAAPEPPAPQGASEEPEPCLLTWSNDQHCMKPAGHEGPCDLGAIEHPNRPAVWGTIYGVDPFACANCSDLQAKLAAAQEEIAEAKKALSEGPEGVLLRTGLGPSIRMWLKATAATREALNERAERAEQSLREKDDEIARLRGNQ